MTCTPIRTDGFTAIVCTRGQRKKPCHYCGRVARYQCDHPVIRKGKRGTCDVWLCGDCRNNVSENVDLCRPHFNLYRNNGMKFKLGDIDVVSKD